MWKSLRDWLKKNERLVAGVTALLFLLQLAHLTWLTTDVVFVGVFGTEPLVPGRAWQGLMLLADYTEIPAIISATLLYLSNPSRASTLYIILVNSQWIHLYWLTDEFAIEVFTGDERSTLLPAWLAWVAILIDYFEIPVIIDTIRRFLRTGKLEPEEE